MIWLQADELLENEGKREIAKAEAAVRYENLKAVYGVLCDLRQIQIHKIPFKDINELKDFLTTLPSYHGDAQKDREARRWKVTKRKPGEIPEWKKRKLAATNAANEELETG